MSLKVKFAILFSLLVSVIMLTGFTFIYFSFADFRSDEFYLRLEQKGLTTCRLLVDVREIDEDLLQIIDRNTINELYDEKVLIFNDSFKVVYSSIDDHRVDFSSDLLNRIKREQKIQFNDGDKEVLGLYLTENLDNKIVIISAYDKFGKRKLKNLKINMLLAALIVLILSGLLSYFYVNQFFLPIEILGNKIKAITGANLKEEIDLQSVQKEFINLAESFNEMLKRIETSFKTQKNFVQNASHELRTPLANLVMQTEIALNKNLSVAEYQHLIKFLNQDLNSLVELSNALLILSEFEDTHKFDSLELLRVDEILYKTIEQTKVLYKDFNVDVIFNNIPDDENELLVNANEVLLQIAFSNLIRNACIYSTNNKAILNINCTNKVLEISISNDGKTITEEEQNQLFTPFFRASNAGKKHGYGLGLAIVKRIIKIHSAKLNYQINVNGLNEFCMLFNKI